MKKGQILEGIVEEVDFPNKGRMYVEDRVVSVKNTLPGQKVAFQVQKLRSGRAEGRLVDVLQKSPLEIKPACLHFAQCGGCAYQNLPYEEQLKLKWKQVRTLLQDVCDEEVFEQVKASPRQFGYRNKMEFSFGDEEKGGAMALGMHKRASFYDIVTVGECKIADSDFRKILSATLRHFQGRGNTFYHKMRHEGCLRHLLVRKGIKTNEILVDLVTSSQETVDEAGFVQAIRELDLDGRLVGVLHTWNDSLADVVCEDRTELLYGQDYFYEEILGLRFKVTPFSFFQTNTLGAEILYDTVREYAKSTENQESRGDEVIFDLYSGTGTIAQLLSPVAGQVIGVELVEEAVDAARRNAQMNGLHNCDFLCGDVLKVLDGIEQKPDRIILDPPRDGVHPKALKKIIAYGVENIVYISCKPTSLARDLAVMREAGYEAKRVCCVDMFPGTSHIETICLLSNQ